MHCAQYLTRVQQFKIYLDITLSGFLLLSVVFVLFFVFAVFDFAACGCTATMDTQPLEPLLQAVRMLVTQHYTQHDETTGSH